MAALRGAFTGQVTKNAHVGDQPSIFDVMSQESLMKSLKPALGHILKYLSAIYPDKFAAAHKNYDELYFCFDLLLQNHFLSKYGASFSENFYGMKRIIQATGQMPLQGFAKLRSLCILVVWPYIRDKLDKFHDDLKLRLTYLGNAAGNKNLKIRIAKLFVKYWPWFKSIIGALTLILQIGYIINRSHIHSPFLWASGVRLEKLTPMDLASFDGLPAHLQPTGILSRLWRMFLAIPGVFYRLFGYGLFFVQFLEFMQNSDIGAQLKKQNQTWTAPPPPHNLLLSESTIHTLETNKCPLCLKSRENSTALAVSGYVFCYTCIDSHLKAYGKCPLTGLPATPKQLIRLYQ